MDAVVAQSRLRGARITSVHGPQKGPACGANVDSARYEWRQPAAAPAPAGGGLGFPNPGEKKIVMNSSAERRFRPVAKRTAGGRQLVLPPLQSCDAVVRRGCSARTPAGRGVEGAAGGVFEADVISASGLYGTLASVKVVSFGAALDVMGNRAVGGVLPPPHTAVTSARAHFLSGWSWGRSLDGEREESSQRRRHGVVEVARDSRA